jgi:hypothetical protein
MNCMLCRLDGRFPAFNGVINMLEQAENRSPRRGDRLPICRAFSLNSYRGDARLFIRWRSYRRTLSESVSTIFSAGGTLINMRRLVLTSLVAMAVFAAIGASLWNSRSTSTAGGSQESERVRVRKEKFTQSLFVTGELAAARAVRISVPRFRERGQVPIQAMAPEGSTVKAGDTLLQIDNAKLIASLNSGGNHLRVLPCSAGCAAESD